MVNECVKEIISNIANGNKFDIDKFEKDLSSLGITLYNTNGCIKSLGSVLEELSVVWNNKSKGICDFVAKCEEEGKHSMSACFVCSEDCSRRIKETSYNHHVDISKQNRIDSYKSIFSDDEDFINQFLNKESEVNN